MKPTAALRERLIEPRRHRFGSVRKALVALGIGAALLVAALAVYVYLFPDNAARHTLEAWRHQAGLVRKEISLPDGLTVAYLEGGTGEPLVLLHGFGADKDAFTPVAQFLTPHYRVLSLDVIGFGESSRPANANYAPPAQAERLRAWLEAMGLGRIHLGGSSMGGQIALTYAARHSNDVASLWLISPAGVWSAPKSELLTRLAEGERNLLLVQSEAEFAELFAFVMSKPPYIPSPVMRALARVRIRNFELERQIFAQIVSYGVEQDAQGLAMPALIVWGDRDRALSVECADILHRRMPRSKVKVMPGIGHLPMIENPKEVAEDYLRFRKS